MTNPNVEKDDFDIGNLENLDIPEVDIEYAAPSEDDGCEGGACKI